MSSGQPARCSAAAASPSANVGMGGEEVVDDGLVLVGQHAAGRVDEATAGLHQRRRRGEDRALLGDELGDGRLRLAPLEVRVAPQRAEAGARRVDQHAVDLAGETLDLRVALVRDQLRVHVRQPRAREPRLQVARGASRRCRTRRAGPASASARPAAASCRRRRRRSRRPSRCACGATRRPTSWLPSSWTSMRRPAAADAARATGVPARAGRAATTASARRRCRRRRAPRAPPRALPAAG